MKYWERDLPHTPALDLARQMLEDCLKAYEVPAEGESEACRIVCAVAADPALPPEGYRSLPVGHCRSAVVGAPAFS